MTANDIAFLGLLLSAAVLGFQTWKKRRAAQQELARRKARAAARYRDRYRQAGLT